MDIKTLIAKIEKLQENIENQSKISQIEIDLQLSNIRALYDAYLEMKANDVCPQETVQAVKEETAEKNTSLLSECGTLPLFGEEEAEAAVAEVVEVPKIAEMPKEEVFEEKEEIVEETVFEDEEISEDEEYTALETEIEEEEEFEDEEEDEIEFEEEETEDLEMLSDINLDDIEFDEDDSEDEVPPVQNTAPAYPIEMPHSRYYGDEIEIENPIPVKPATIGEQFKRDRPTLNEIVSSYKPDESIGVRLQQTNISDLMKSIDMNQKFMFVKELFKGNGSAFTEEINKLNEFRKLNEAIPYLESIKLKYKWDSQSEAYAELSRLVLRKFAK